MTLVKNFKTTFYRTHPVQNVSGFSIKDSRLSHFHQNIMIKYSKFLLFRPFWAYLGILQVSIKGALSGLRQFLATENPLKMIKNTFYLTLKALLVLNTFKFLSWLFGHVEKWLDLKDKVSFKIYDVTTWKTNSCNTHINQYLEK